MILEVKLLVLGAYMSAVTLDFISQQRQFTSLFLKKGIGASYALKNKLGLVSRGFSFAVAPALGYLAAKVDPIELVQLFLICTFLGLITISFSYKIFCTRFSKQSNDGRKSLKSIGFAERYTGYIAFSIAVNATFVLNILASANKADALWMVQLTPIMTALSTGYIIFFYDVRIAEVVDERAINFSDAKVFLTERLWGRALAFIAVAFWYNFSAF
jgi:hypothetical protein